MLASVWLVEMFNTRNSFFVSAKQMDANWTILIEITWSRDNLFQLSRMDAGWMNYFFVWDHKKNVSQLLEIKNVSHFASSPTIRSFINLCKWMLVDLNHFYLKDFKLNLQFWNFSSSRTILNVFGAQKKTFYFVWQCSNMWCVVRRKLIISEMKEAQFSCAVFGVFER